MKEMKRLQKIGVTLAVGAALVAGSLTVTTFEAHALGGGNCWAWLENQVGLTNGAGRCSSLNGDTKARVTLDLTNAPDFHSGWFTQTNTTYRTVGWSAAMGYGWPRAARVDHAKR